MEKESLWYWRNESIPLKKISFNYLTFENHFIIMNNISLFYETV
jgi:hypothetical protein